MNNYPSLILQCEDSVEGILTAIYDAFVEKNKMSDYQDGDISIAIGDNLNANLFARELRVQTDLDKAQKTLLGIQRKISYQAYQNTVSALCHFSLDRGDAVLGYLVKGFSMGARVSEDLSNPYVMRVMELSRKVWNESHLFCGVVRFHDLGKFLYSEVEPKCNVLPRVMEHFEDRLPNEHYVIYDSHRKMALVHPAYQQSFFVYGEDFHIDVSQRADHFETLWAEYFAHIAIQERKNPRCQNNLLPKWYRKNMVEFS